MIRCFIRLVVLPALIIVHILEWFGMYIVHYSGILCKLIAGAIFMLVTIGFVTGLGNGEQLTKMLVVSFFIFLIPQLGGIIVRVLSIVHAALRKLAGI